MFFTVPIINVGKRNCTGYNRQNSQKEQTTVVLFYFQFSIFYLSLGRKQNCVNAKSRYKQGKVLALLLNHSWNANSGGK